MSNRFDGILEFAAVARLGSFTAASAELGLTKSAVARAVSRLEGHLGTKLMHRTTRRLTLTSDGVVWLKHCLAALGELSWGEELVGSSRPGPSGKVRIDLPSAFGRQHIMPVLLELARKHPALTFNISFTDRRIDLMAEGIDLAVRIGVLDDDLDLVASPLGWQRMVICAAPSYLELRGTPRSVADIAHHRCVVGWRSEHDAYWLLKQPDGSIAPHRVPATYEIYDHDALLAAVGAGLGIAQLPSWLARGALDAGSIVTVLDGVSGGELPISILWPRTGMLPARLRIVVDEMIEVVGGLSDDIGRR
jgi:DNA-binding transcriptional LysR family regulator